MKALVFLVLLASLVTGCASTGQAGANRDSAGETAAPVIALPTTVTPARTKLYKPPATIEPAVNASTGGVVLSAYDTVQKVYNLRPVDPATGEMLPGFMPLRVSQGLEYLPWVVYSPNGSKLAAIESRGESCETYAGGVGCYPRAIALHLVDLPSWQVISTTLPADGWVGTMTYSPAGDRLAVSYNREKESTVLIADTSSGTILSKLPLGFRPEKIAFYRDGNRLLAYGALPGEEPGTTPPGPLHLGAYTVPTGENLWMRDLAEVTTGFWCLEGCKEDHGRQLYANWAPAIVLAPDGSALYIYHADQELLTRISLADGSSEDVQVREAQSWVERLLSATAGVALAKGGTQGTTRQAVISPDGKRLYVLSTTTHSEVNQDGFWVPTDVVTELQVIDPQDGQILARTPAIGYGLRLSPDGKYLLIDNWMGNGLDTAILDTVSLESVATSDGWMLVFSPDLDRKTRLLGKLGSNTFALFDPESFQPLKIWKYKGRAYWAASP